MAHLIREGKTFQLATIMQTSKAQGMVTMNESLLELVKTKQIEPQEAWRKATDKTGLQGLFKRAGMTDDLGRGGTALQSRIDGPSRGTTDPDATVPSRRRGPSRHRALDIQPMLLF